MDELLDEFYALRKKANVEKPAAKDMAALRQFLRDHPAVLAEVNNLNQLATANVVNRISMAKGDREVLRAELQQQREDLGFDEAPPLIQLLIDHVVLCWLRLQLAELAYTSAALGEAGAMNVDRKVEFFDKRLDAAQRRYLYAARTLDRVRHRPVVAQFNIAQQQVVTA